MHTPAEPKHQVRTALFLLILVFLYIASWPPIELMSAQEKEEKFFEGVDSYSGGITINQPRWMKIVYLPLHQWCKVYPEDGGPNLLGHYWLFWSHRLDVYPRFIYAGELD